MSKLLDVLHASSIKSYSRTFPTKILHCVWTIAGSSHNMVFKIQWKCFISSCFECLESVKFTSLDPNPGYKIVKPKTPPGQVELSMYWTEAWWRRFMIPTHVFRLNYRGLDSLPHKKTLLTSYRVSYFPTTYNKTNYRPWYPSFFSTWCPPANNSFQNS